MNPFRLREPAGGDHCRREIATGEFDGYRAYGYRWMGDGEEAE